MADTYDVTLTGDEEVISAFTRAAVSAPLRASGVIRRTALNVAESQRHHVPVDTGALQDAIEATTPRGGTLGPGALQADIGPRAQTIWGAPLHYARFVEYGTAKMGPRPFVFVGFESQRAQFESDMERVAHQVFDG